MKKISTRNAILAGIFGWVSFLLADSICFTLLTMKVFWQPAAVVSAVIGAMAARWISYSFARSKAVGFCIVFVALTAAVQYFCLLSRYKYLYRCGLKDGATQELSKANWYKDKFLSLGGDDKLLKIVPDNANATAYQRMGDNACIEKEAMSHEC